LELRSLKKKINTLTGKICHVNVNYTEQHRILCKGYIYGVKQSHYKPGQALWVPRG
jgi:hypothetical protein